ncbi:replication-relaxation family protein [Pseudonocardia sp.]|uniref:replication-relaxation family protein n=1 Tax=Pseudonocardia sp. TaxID=60912 RepID=UPI0031FDE7E6
MTALTLPSVAGAMVQSLAAHRLLTARQLHDLHTPQASPRWTRDVLGRLVERELVAFVHAGWGARRVYFLTDQGHQALNPTRPARADGARHAASALSAHTLAVNEVGVAFVAAARKRGDEFGPLAWRHEVAHPIGTATVGRRKELVIADAVLTYLQHLDDGALAFHYRFLELDRATEPTAALAAKLIRYARLHSYTTNNHKEPLWHQNYPVFPEILVVLDGATRAALHRRAMTVLTLCQADPQLRRTPEVAISTCVLEDLVQHGPWAPIFERLYTDRPTAWTGEPA